MTAYQYSTANAAQAAPLPTTYSNNAVVLLGIGAGFVLVPAIAQHYPELVNGFLLVLLFGIVLTRTDEWLPVLKQLGTVGSKG